MCVLFAMTLLLVFATRLEFFVYILCGLLFTTGFLDDSEPREFKVHLKLIGTGIFGDLGPQI